MKLPTADDPHGDREGALPRDRILEVLYRHGVSVIHDEDGDVVLRRGSRLEVQQLPDPVGGLLIRQLARTFEIPLVAFYVDEPRYH